MLAGNPDHVQVYTSWDYGLQAVKATLSPADPAAGKRAQAYGYPAILAALAAGNDAGRVRDAVVHSAWGTKWFPV